MCDALKSSPLDPMRIGVAIVRVVEPIQREYRRSQALIAANRAILTGEQLARLGILELADRLSATVQLAQDDGFMKRGDKFADLFFGINFYFSDQVRPSPEGTADPLTASWTGWFDWRPWTRFYWLASCSQ